MDNSLWIDVDHYVRRVRVDDDYKDIAMWIATEDEIRLHKLYERLNKI